MAVVRALQGGRNLRTGPRLQQFHPAAQPAYERGRRLAGHHPGENARARGSTTKLKSVPSHASSRPPSAPVSRHGHAAEE